MIKLPDIIDTWNLLDKYDLEKGKDYTYDESLGICTITSTGESKLPPKSNKAFWNYVKRVANGGHFKTSSRRSPTLAADAVSNNEIVFTPAALLDIVSKIDELSEYEIGLTTTLDNQLQLQVGDSVYDLTSESDVNDISVDDSVVEDVSEINEDAYEQILDDDGEEAEPIESGLVKELIKTLAIGGVVRLGKNYLTKPGA